MDYISFFISLHRQYPLIIKEFYLICITINNYNYCKMRKTTLKTMLIGISLPLCMLNSCTTDEYDLNDDNLSFDIQVGGNLTIPMGDAEKTLIGSLLKADNQLQIDPVTGNYSIAENGSIDETDFSIDKAEIEVDPIESDGKLNFRLEEIDIPFNSAKSLGKISFVAPVYDNENSFNVNSEVPNELKNIKNITFLNDAKVSISIQLIDHPMMVEEVSFRDFKIQLPKFINFEADPDLDENNMLTLNTAFNPSGHTKDLIIKGMNFTEMNNGEGLTMKEENGKNMLSIDSDNGIVIDGDIVIENMQLSLNDLENIHYDIRFNIDPMVIKEATGKVDPVIDPINEKISIDLSEDADFLKEEGTELILENPILLLEVNNNTGIPVAAQCNLFATDKNNQLINTEEAITIPINIKKAAINGITTTTKLLISKKPTNREGYENIVIPELSNLLKRIPEHINFKLEAQADQSQEHIIDLTKEMNISGKYDVQVELQFENINIDYTYDVEELSNDLSDFTKNLTKATMEINTTIVNTIPIGMEINVLPLDINGNVIKDVEVNIPQKIKADASTDVIMTLKSENGSLQNLETLRFNVKGHSDVTTSDKPLNSNQYLQFTKMFIKIVDGITLDLNDLDNDDDKLND